MRPEADGAERVFLLTEGDPIMLRGPLFARLAARLDGRSVAELVAALADHHPAAQVLYGLLRLQRAGYLVDVDPPAATFEPHELAAPLMVRGVEVQLVADLTAERLARVTAERWVPVVLAGRQPMFGPLFDRQTETPDTPCWRCVQYWLRHNRPVERYLSGRRGAPIPPPPRVGDPEVAAAAVAAFAPQLVAALVDVEHPARWSVAIYDAPAGALRWHRVVRRPQCPDCGDPGWMRRRGTQPVELEPRPKAYTADGGHRVCAPDLTHRRFAPLIDPITGPIARLEPAASRDHPLRPVWAAAWRVCPLDRAPGFDDFDRPALGKGRTVAQARTGALCEALERFSSMAQGDEASTHGVIDAIEGAVHPDALQLFSDRQYAERDTYNATVDDSRKRVPPPFDETHAIDWTPAWSLSHDRRCHLPAAYCWSFRPRSTAEQAIVFDPNGHAAGNCLEEAILQGLLERVERDAVGIWWYARTRRPAVDLDGLPVPWFRQVREHYAEQRFSLWVLDLTTDLGVPVCAALARRGEGAEAQHCIGFGAHLDPVLAAQRAVSELNQLFDPQAMPAPWDHPALIASGPEAAAFLDPCPTARPAAVGRLAPSDDITTDVLALVDRLAQAGIETIVVDQTRPDIGLSTVKVVTPGLRHFWPRLGPGRLYTVPAHDGIARDEALLNPVHLFL